MTDAKPLRVDARRNRDALIARARALFDTGDEELRFDDFAGAAGVGTGTLYRHFPTREALAAAVYREEVVTLCALARDLAGRLPPGEALAAFLRAMVDHVDGHQRLARRLAALLTAIPDELAQSGEDLERAVAELLAAAVSHGDVRGDARIGSVMMALHGISATSGRAGWRADADGAIDLVLDGLRPPDSGS